MFKTNRSIYLEAPRPREEEAQIQSQTPEVSPERMAEAREFAESTADVILAVESGDTEGATMAFYKAYLESPEKLKRYSTFMMMTTVPPLAILRELPIIGSLVKVQVAMKDRAIDVIYGAMKKIQTTAEESEAYKALRKAEGQWNRLSEEEQTLVKEMLEELVRK